MGGELLSHFEAFTFVFIGVVERRKMTTAHVTSRPNKRGFISWPDHKGLQCRTVARHAVTYKVSFEECTIKPHGKIVPCFQRNLHIHSK